MNFVYSVDMSPLPRPDIALSAIIGYALFAFGLGLLFTPWFIAFLRKNRLGKQLRVETVDGREASIFRKYHEKKFGTPTMGGILIWGSIVLTVIFSRFLAFSGAVSNSLLQRGQVYLPLFVMLSFGVLGAIDDYLNVVGNNEEQWKKMLHPIRMFFVAGTVAGLAVGIPYVFVGRFHTALNHLALPPIGVFCVYVLVLLYLGALTALVDDFFKRRANQAVNRKGGLTAMAKLSSLLLVSVICGWWFSSAGKLHYDQLTAPCWGSLSLAWGNVAFHVPLISGTFAFNWPFFLLSILVLVGTANAVNVTDGLDGLAGGLLVIAFGSFGVLAYVMGLSVLAAFCAITAAAVCAFLWHNVPPALFYMGDTGALALGGALGAIALMTNQVLLLPLIGFVFLLEMLSVIIQLTSKKFRGGKKVFKAAPIHHHFEALEWGESKVTMRLWIVGAFCGILGIILGLMGK